MTYLLAYAIMILGDKNTTLRKGEIEMKGLKGIDLVEQFLNRMYGGNKSPKTITNYRVDLRFYLEYLEESGAEVEGADLQVLEGYTVHLRDMTYGDNKKYSENTIARRISTVKSFYDYLRARGIREDDPSQDLESPKVETGKEPVFISKEKIAELMASTIGETHETRDRLILKLFMSTGMRLSELEGLNVSDIEGTQITIRRGKGNKTRRVFISEDLVEEIREYTSSRCSTIEPLFISQKGGRLSERSIQRAVKKYMDKAGLDLDKFSTHSLRHTFASIMLQQGVDIVTIQQSLGHSSLETTQRYVHTLDESRQKAADVMANVF